MAVNVGTAPRIDTSRVASPFMARYGGSAEIVLAIHGEPPPTVRWYIGPNPVYEGMNYSFRTIGHHHTLIIHNVSEEVDKGIYVAASNYIGEDSCLLEIKTYQVKSRHRSLTDIRRRQTHCGSKEELPVERQRLRVRRQGQTQSLSAVTRYSSLPRQRATGGYVVDSTDNIILQKRDNSYTSLPGKPVSEESSPLIYGKDLIRPKRHSSTDNVSTEVTRTSAPPIEADFLIQDVNLHKIPKAQQRFPSDGGTLHLNDTEDKKKSKKKKEKSVSKKSKKSLVETELQQFETSTVTTMDERYLYQPGSANMSPNFNLQTFPQSPQTGAYPTTEYSDHIVPESSATVEAFPGQSTEVPASEEKKKKRKKKKTASTDDLSEDSSKTKKKKKKKSKKSLGSSVASLDTMSSTSSLDCEQDNLMDVNIETVENPFDDPAQEGKYLTPGLDAAIPVEPSFDTQETANESRLWEVSGVRLSSLCNGMLTQNGNQTHMETDIDGDLNVTQSQVKETNIDEGYNLPISKETDIDAGYSHFIPRETDIDAGYDKSVFKETDLDAGFSQQIPKETDIDAGYSLPVQTETDIDAGYSQQIPRETDIDAGYSLPVSIETDIDAGYSQPVCTETDIDAGYNQQIPRETDIDAGYNQQIPHETDVDAGYNQQFQQETAIDDINIPPNQMETNIDASNPLDIIMPAPTPMKKSNKLKKKKEGSSKDGSKKKKKTKSKSDMDTSELLVTEITSETDVRESLDRDSHLVEPRQTSPPASLAVEQYPTDPQTSPQSGIVIVDSPVQSQFIYDQSPITIDEPQKIEDMQEDVTNTIIPGEDTTKATKKKKKTKKSKKSKSKENLLEISQTESLTDVSCESIPHSVSSDTSYESNALNESLQSGIIMNDSLNEQVFYNGQQPIEIDDVFDNIEPGGPLVVAPTIIQDAPIKKKKKKKTASTDDLSDVSVEKVKKKKKTLSTNDLSDVSSEKIKKKKKTASTDDLSDVANEKVKKRKKSKKSTKSVGDLSVVDAIDTQAATTIEISGEVISNNIEADDAVPIGETPMADPSQVDDQNIAQQDGSLKTKTKKKKKRKSEKSQENLVILDSNRLSASDEAALHANAPVNFDHRRFDDIQMNQPPVVEIVDDSLRDAEDVKKEDDPSSTSFKLNEEMQIDIDAPIPASPDEMFADIKVPLPDSDKFDTNFVEPEDNLSHYVNVPDSELPSVAQNDEDSATKAPPKPKTRKSKVKKSKSKERLNLDGEEAADSVPKKSKKSKLKKSKSKEILAVNGHEINVTEDINEQQQQIITTVDAGQLVTDEAADTSYRSSIPEVHHTDFPSVTEGSLADESYIGPESESPKKIKKKKKVKKIKKTKSTEIATDVSPQEVESTEVIPSLDHSMPNEEETGNIDRYDLDGYVAPSQEDTQIQMDELEYLVPESREPMQNEDIQLSAPTDNNNQMQIEDSEYLMPESLETGQKRDSSVIEEKPEEKEDLLRYDLRDMDTPSFETNVEDNKRRSQQDPFEPSLVVPAVTFVDDSFTNEDVLVADNKKDLVLELHPPQLNENVAESEPAPVAEDRKSGDASFVFVPDPVPKKKKPKKIKKKKSSKSSVGDDAAPEPSESAHISPDNNDQSLPDDLPPAPPVPPPYFNGQETEQNQAQIVEVNGDLEVFIPMEEDAKPEQEEKVVKRRKSSSKKGKKRSSKTDSGPRESVSDVTNRDSVMELVNKYHYQGPGFIESEISHMDSQIPEEAETSEVHRITSQEMKDDYVEVPLATTIDFLPPEVHVRESEGTIIMNVPDIIMINQDDGSIIKEDPPAIKLDDVPSAPVKKQKPDLPAKPSITKKPGNSMADHELEPTFSKQTKPKLPPKPTSNHIVPPPSISEPVPAKKTISATRKAPAPPVKSSTPNGSIEPVSIKAVEKPNLLESEKPREGITASLKPPVAPKPSLAPLALDEIPFADDDSASASSDEESSDDKKWKSMTNIILDEHKDDKPEIKPKPLRYKGAPLNVWRYDHQRSQRNRITHSQDGDYSPLSTSYYTYDDALSRSFDRSSLASDVPSVAMSAPAYGRWATCADSTEDIWRSSGDQDGHDYDDANPLRSAKSEEILDTGKHGWRFMSVDIDIDEPEEKGKDQRNLLSVPLMPRMKGAKSEEVLSKTQKARDRDFGRMKKSLSREWEVVTTTTKEEITYISKPEGSKNADAVPPEITSAQEEPIVLYEETHKVIETDVGTGIVKNVTTDIEELTETVITETVEVVPNLSAPDRPEGSEEVYAPALVEDSSDSDSTGTSLSEKKDSVLKEDISQDDVSCDSGSVERSLSPSMAGEEISKDDLKSQSSVQSSLLEEAQSLVPSDVNVSEENGTIILSIEEIIRIDEPADIDSLPVKEEQETPIQVARVAEPATVFYPTVVEEDDKSNDQSVSTDEGITEDKTTENEDTTSSKGGPSEEDEEEEIQHATIYNFEELITYELRVETVHEMDPIVKNIHSLLRDRNLNIYIFVETLVEMQKAEKKKVKELNWKALDKEKLVYTLQKKQDPANRNLAIDDLSRFTKDDSDEGMIMNKIADHVEEVKGIIGRLPKPKLGTSTSTSNEGGIIKFDVVPVSDENQVIEHVEASYNMKQESCNSLPSSNDKVDKSEGDVKEESNVFEMLRDISDAANKTQSHTDSVDKDGSRDNDRDCSDDDYSDDDSEYTDEASIDENIPAFIQQDVGGLDNVFVHIVSDSDGKIEEIKVVDRGEAKHNGSSSESSSSSSSSSSSEEDEAENGESGAEYDLDDQTTKSQVSDNEEKIASVKDVAVESYPDVRAEGNHRTLNVIQSESEESGEEESSQSDVSGEEIPLTARLATPQKAGPSQSTAPPESPLNSSVLASKAAVPGVVGTLVSVMVLILAAVVIHFLTYTSEDNL